MKYIIRKEIMLNKVPRGKNEKNLNGVKRAITLKSIYRIKINKI
jgi:hypothetical protein